MCWSAAERSDGVITEDHVGAAHYGINDIERSILEDLVFAGKNPLSGPIDKVKKMLRLQNIITAAELSREFYRDLDSDGINKLMVQLQQMGQAKMVLLQRGYALQAIEQLPDPAEDADVPV